MGMFTPKPKAEPKTITLVDTTIQIVQDGKEAAARAALQKIAGNLTTNELELLAKFCANPSAKEKALSEMNNYKYLIL